MIDNGAVLAHLCGERASMAALLEELVRMETPSTDPGSQAPILGRLKAEFEDIGYRAALTSLARGRIHIAALAVGSAQRALDESVAFATTATQGGSAVGTFQLVQAMLAEQQAGVMAGRALVRDAARMWLTGEDRRIAPSVAKLFCTEMAGTVADIAVQVHGGTGYMRGVPVERIYREVRVNAIGGGSEEIMRDLAARQIGL